MKKIFIFIFTSLFIIQNTTIVKAKEVFLDKKDSLLVEKFVQRAKNIIEENGENYKVLILLSLDEKIATIKPEEEKYEVFTTLREQIENLGEKEAGEDELKNYTIDIKKVREAWLSWQNEERKSLGKTAYNYDENLNKTADEWSNISKERGYIDHKRNSWDAYYDYNKISSWLKERGVVCKKISKMTYSESIGWGTFSCDDEECSDETIEAIKWTFIFYMSEKWRSSAPHYNAMINSKFEYIWLWLSIQKNWNKYKYFATTHYCTTLISN